MNSSFSRARLKDLSRPPRVAIKVTRDVHCCHGEPLKRAPLNVPPTLRRSILSKTPILQYLGVLCIGLHHKYMPEIKCYDYFYDIISASSSDEAKEALTGYVLCVNEHIEPYSTDWFYHIRRGAESAERYLERYNLPGDMLNIPEFQYDDITWAADGMILGFINIRQGDYGFAMDVLSDTNHYIEDDDIGILEILLSDIYLSNWENASIQEAFTYAEKAVKKHPDNAFASLQMINVAIVAIESDESISVGPGIKQNKGELLSYVESKLESISDSLEEYSEYYKAKGKVDMINNRPGSAVDNFEEAIRRLDHNQERSSEYYLEYEQLRLEAKIEKLTTNLENKFYEIEARSSHVKNTLEEIEDATDDIESEVNTFRRQTVQFLGFFTALLSLIIASVNIIATFDFIEAAGLLMILAGGISVSFWSLSFFIAPSSEEYRKQWPILVMGILAILLGLFIPSLL